LTWVRARLDAFLGQIRQVEERRRAIAGDISQGREVLAILEEDLHEIRAEEEQRLNEWVIDRDAAPGVARAAPMPWARGGEDDRRFRNSLGASLAAALIFGFVFPLVDLPLPEPVEVLEVPERVVELIRRDRARVQPPPAAIVEQRPEPVQEPVPEPVEPEPQLVAEEPPPAPEPRAAEPGPAQEPPRQRAQSSGILAFRESLSSIAANRPAARLGADARISRAGDAAIGVPQRSMVTSQAPGSSGGINLASLSRDVGGGGGGGQMAGVATTRVESSIGSGGGGGRAGGAGEGSGGVAGRTDEEIQIVFDRYKASLYRLYNRELRNDPTLRGQMVLRLTIEPNGSVSFIELQSTDMNAPSLAQQVLERVRTFDFGAKDVAAITIVYPIDFLPAA
jgi:outer membrane biosynthesis protein TonB